MSGKPQFRGDVDTDFCEIGDDGKPYWIRDDGAREPVADPEQAQKLLDKAKEYGIIDPLEGTSIQAFQNRELTIGSLMENEEENRADLIRRATNLTGASAGFYDEWSVEQLQRLIEETRKLTEPPPETSTHPSVWGKRLTVGDLTKKEEEEK